MIIAESGGSKTDWILLDGDRVIDRLATRSYHPNQWDDRIGEEQIRFWKSHSNWLSVPLYFFGAGCFREVKQIQMHGILEGMGLNPVRIYSDLHAAGYALHGEKEGWGAILGTGSVLFHWKDEQVHKICGGKGSKEGDEGSGFYFGKLWLLANAPNSPELKQLKVQLQSDPELNRYEIAQIAKAKGKLPMSESIHIQNIQLFIQKELKNESISRLSIVGGYAAHFEQIIRSVFYENGIQIDEIIDRPIDRLIEQKALFID